jgi:hypothetical protein
MPTRTAAATDSRKTRTAAGCSPSERPTTAAAAWRRRVDPMRAKTAAGDTPNARPRKSGITRIKMSTNAVARTIRNQQVPGERARSHVLGSATLTIVLLLDLASR